MNFKPLVILTILKIDQAKEPELVKAVKYAQKEYPCLLHCLKNGHSIFRTMLSKERFAGWQSTATIISLREALMEV